MEDATEGPLLEFLSNQHLVAKFSDDVSLKDWAVNVLLKFLVTSVRSILFSSSVTHTDIIFPQEDFSSETSLALYHTALYLVGYNEDGSELTSNAVLENFSPQNVISHAPAFVEARHVLFHKHFGLE